MTLQTVPVLAVPLIDVDGIRVEVDLPAGLTITAMIAAVLPGGGPDERSRVRVTLVTAQHIEVVQPDYWHLTRPRPGIQVVIRVIPAGKAASSLLQIFVTVAALALGQFWAPAFAATAFGKAAIGLAATAVGSLVARAFITPPDTPEKERPRYSIASVRNEIRKDGVIPYPMGDMRWTPPFAVPPYSVIKGGDQYIRFALLPGYGPLSIAEADVWIGDTPISKYTSWKLEIFEGVAGDPKSKIIRDTVIERAYGVELTRPLPRDELGEIVAGDAIETPVVRYTARDTKTVRSILYFAGGLTSIDGEGDLYEIAVDIKILMRPIGSTGAWTDVTTLHISEASRQPFYREHVWDVPARGAYEISHIRMTPERRSTKAQDTCTLVAIQSILPEYPFQFDAPTALVIGEIKATYQLNGALDNINIRAKRRALDWDHLTDAWVMRETRNPASAYRQVLQIANLFPDDDAGINLEQLEDWHDLCRVRGYSYDRVHDFIAKRDEVLEAIAAVGLAAPRFDGVREGLVIDNPAALPIIDHVDNTNADSFEAHREYVDFPHAFVIEFLDETNDHKPAKRIVRWPGYLGDITVTERLDLPGITNPDQIFLQARRRQLEILHRADDYTCTQTGAARIATRGSKIRMATPIVNVYRSARVKQKSGKMLVLDDDVTMSDPGGTYAIAYKVGGSDGNAAGTSLVRQVVTETGTTHILRMLVSDSRLKVGDTLHFGPMSSESSLKLVNHVEATQDMGSILHLVDAAQQIDEILAATDIPAWSSRLGTEVPTITEAPDAPSFAAIRSGVLGTGSADGLRVRLRAAATGGDVQTFALDHRMNGKSAWTTVTIPVGSSVATIAGYEAGDYVQLLARGIAKDGTVGANNVPVIIQIGALDGTTPAALDGAAIEVTRGMGSAAIAFATSADRNTRKVKVWRAATAVLNTSSDVDIATLAVQTRETYSLVDGDASRTNLTDISTMTLATGWSRVDTTLTKAPGVAGAASKSMVPISSRAYRIGMHIATRTAGSVTAQLSATPSTISGVAQTTTGWTYDRLVSTGQDTFELSASSTFAGSIDRLVVYPETAACLAQGTYYYFFEPINDDGISGPISGPFAAIVI